MKGCDNLCGMWKEQMMSLPLYAGIGLGLGLAADYCLTVYSWLGHTFFAGGAHPPLPPLHEGLYRKMADIDPGDSVMDVWYGTSGKKGEIKAQGIVVESGDEVTVQTLRSIIEGNPQIISCGRQGRYSYSKGGWYPTFFKDFKKSIEEACGGKVEWDSARQVYRLTGDHKLFNECAHTLSRDIGDFADPQASSQTTGRDAKASHPHSPFGSDRW